MNIDKEVEELKKGACIYAPFTRRNKTDLETAEIVRLGSKDASDTYSVPFGSAEL